MHPAAGSTTVRPSPAASPWRRLTNSGVVALTFDDGPDAEHTPRVLDLLASFGARATFFVLGTAAMRHRALVERIVAEGHTLGSHGFSHRHPWWQSGVDAVDDVTHAASVLADICREPVRWFRPPFGRVRRCMTEAAVREGQQLVLWSRSAIDWGPFARPSAIRRRLASIAGGDIVLLHDGRNKHNRPYASIEALAQTLPDLAARFSLLRLDDAIATPSR